jgi:hypothetical protein
MEAVMNPDDKGDAAFQRLLALTDSPEFDTYPNRTHFIAAANPRHDKMATRALREGDPVLLVFDEGNELLICPEPSGGARLEARDPAKNPIAA